MVTPTAQEWEFEPDPATWLQIPYTADAHEADEWIERASSAVVADFSVDATLPAEYLTVLRAQLSELTDLARAKFAEYGMLLAHLPGPAWLPHPVFVNFREPEEESTDYLPRLAGVGLDAIEAPDVSYVTTDDLGEGIRVLRYERSDEFGVVANLCFAWRADPNLDVVLFVQTNELALLHEMEPDLISLAASIHPVRS